MKCDGCGATVERYPNTKFHYGADHTICGRLRRLSGKIPIAEAEQISKRHRCPIVLIFAVAEDGNHFNITTYGATKALCRHAADLSKKFADAVLGGTVTPAAEEPVELPNAPTIFDGTISGLPENQE